MGINGLLPFLTNASRKCDISEFRGCTVVIDSYCWLHRGAYACVHQIVMGKTTDIYVKYCLKLIRLLESHHIKPIMVFDGQRLAAKQLIEERRRANRSSARIRAKELMRVGCTEEAQRLFKQCLDITHEMALNLIKECRSRNIDCIVAPYEADAQMSYLNIQGIADFVITEDSDLVMFGCSKILYKLDVSGSGILIEKEKLIYAMKIRPDLYTFDKFRHMCILSGCDYLDSLPGIGLKRAHRVITSAQDSNMDNVLRKLPQYLNMNRLKVSKEYIEQFKLANAALKHQIVYDPLKRCLVRLTAPNDYDADAEYLRNAGDVYDNEKAFQMALGNIDPITLKVLDNWNPDDHEMSVNSIWSRSFSKPKPAVSVSTAIMNAKSTEDKQTMVNINLNHISSVELQKKIDYDLKLAEELKVYYTPKHPLKVTQPEFLNEETFKVSNQHLAANNPFLIPKPLSKFGTTKLESTKIIRSTFFENRNKQECINNDSCKFSKTLFANVNKEKIETSLENDRRNKKFSRIENNENSFIESYESTVADNCDSKNMLNVNKNVIVSDDHMPSTSNDNLVNQTNDFSTNILKHYTAKALASNYSKKINKKSQNSKKSNICHRGKMSHKRKFSQSNTIADIFNKIMKSE